MNWRQLPLLLLAVFAWSVAPGCLGEETGACQEVTGKRFNCKDGWTADECADWDRQQINGNSWAFHEGQTCDERE